MEITINELLEGKATLIKNKEYFNTKRYVQPFLEKMKPFTNDFRVKVKLPNQITVGQTHDITYNRVLVEAILPTEYDCDNHSEVISFFYGLDVRKPLSKLYRGFVNKDNGNFLVFDESWLKTSIVEPEEFISIDVKGLMETTGSFKRKLEDLKNKTIKKEELYPKLGTWVHKGLKENYFNNIHNVKLSRNHAVDAYKLLALDADSEYFRDLTSDEPTPLYDVYNAFAEIITKDDKDIMNKFEKTLLINKLLEV